MTVMSSSNLNNTNLGEPGISIELSGPQVEYLVNIVGDDYDAIRLRATELLDLAIKVTSLSSAVVSLDTIQKAVDESKDNIEAQSGNLVKRLNETGELLANVLDEKITGENSEFSTAISESITEVNSAIELLKDPTRTDSLVYVVGELTKTHMAQAQQSFLGALDLNQPNSIGATIIQNLNTSFAQSNAAIVKLAQKVESNNESLLAQMGLKQALDDAESKGSLKGVAFEQEVSEQLIEVTNPYEDTFEDIGSKTDGIGSSKKGDHVVTVLSDSREIGKIVIEDKAGKITLKGNTSLENELEDAMTVNNAVAAIGIVDSKFAPVALQKVGMMNPQPGMYIIAVEREADDFRLLKMLYPIVRAQVVATYFKNLDSDINVNAEVVRALCAIGLNDLVSFNKIKKNLKDGVIKTTKGCIDELTTLHGSLEECLDNIISQFSAKGGDC